MSTPFATAAPVGSTPFAPRKEPMNLREYFLDYIARRGWLLDPDAQIPVKRFTPEAGTKQDPLAFIRFADDGVNTWHARLDYVSRDQGNWNGKTDNTLRGVTIWLAGPDGAKIGRSETLETPKRGSYASPNYLWNVIDRDGQMSLRKRAERLMSNPELTMWLLAEDRHRRELERIELTKKQERAARLRRKAPKGVTVDKEDWDKLTSELYYAASALRRTSGTTPDLSKLWTDVVTAMSAVSAVVTTTEGSHE